MNERAFLIHYHAVTLRESRARMAMGHRGFSFTLLEWAGNARRRASALREPKQLGLI